MEEQIYINGVLMEQAQGKSASLVFQSPFFTDIDSIVSNRTNAIDFPATDNNLQAIDNAHMSGSTSLYEYRHHHVVYCRDGVQIFVGRGTLLSLTPSALKFSFVWGNTNAFQSLFDTKLQDLQGAADEEGNYVDWTTANINSGALFYSGISFGNSTMRHPIMPVSDVLARIANRTGITINNSSIFNSYALPLLTKKADDYAKEAQGLIIHTGKVRVYAPASLNNYRPMLENLLMPDEDAGDSDIDGLHLGDGMYDVSDKTELVIKFAECMTYRCANNLSVYGSIVIKGLNDSTEGGRVLATVQTALTSSAGGYNTYTLQADRRVKLDVSQYQLVAICLSYYYKSSGWPSEYEHSYEAYKTILDDVPFVSAVVDFDSDQLVAFGGKFPLYLNLPDWECSKLLKNLMKVKGVFPYCTSDTAIDFVGIDTLYNNRASAYDWTDRLILDDGQPDEKLSTMNSYAQQNNCKYTTDETVTRNFDSSIVVDNETLDKEADLITLDFAATDGTIIKVYSLNDSTVEYNESIVPRILKYTGSTNPAGQRIVSFDGLDWKTLLSTNYVTYQAVVEHPHVIKAQVLLLPNEIATLDLTKPVYSYVLGHYYAISKLTTKDNNLADVELFQLGGIASQEVVQTEEEELVVLPNASHTAFVTALPARTAAEQAAITANSNYKVCILRYGYTRRGKAGTKTDRIYGTIGTHTSRNKTYKRYRRGKVYRIIGEEVLIRGSFSTHSQTGQHYTASELVAPLGSTISLPNCKPTNLTLAGRVHNQAKNGMNELWVALYHRNDSGKWECVSNKVQVRGINSTHTGVWEFEQSNIVLGAI